MYPILIPIEIVETIKGLILESTYFVIIKHEGTIGADVKAIKNIMYQ